MDKLLRITQREHAGSRAFQNFDYQYHWAIFYLLEQAIINEDIAIFVEYHDDVLLVENLSTKNIFHFIQVKANDKHLTINDITKNQDGMSILNKLAPRKDYEEVLSQIKYIKLVSANGFNFINSNHEVEFSCLSEENRIKIRESLDIEIDVDVFLEKLYFQHSELPKQSFEITVEGKISRLANQLYPTKKYNSNAIYLVIKQDFHDKGKKVVDSNKSIHDIVREKGITYQEVKNVIKAHTDLEDNQSTINIALEIIDEMKDIPRIEKFQLKKTISEYATKSLIPMEFCFLIKEQIIKLNLIQKIKDTTDIPNYNLLNQYSNMINQEFNLDLDLDLKSLEIKAGIIYEFTKEL